MNKLIKKFLSSVLAVGMLLTAIPFTVSADGGQQQQGANYSTKNTISLSETIYLSDGEPSTIQRLQELKISLDGDPSFVKVTIGEENTETIWNVDSQFNGSQIFDYIDINCEFEIKGKLTINIPANVDIDRVIDVSDAYMDTFKFSGGEFEINNGGHLGHVFFLAVSEEATFENTKITIDSTNDVYCVINAFNGSTVNITNVDFNIKNVVDNSADIEKGFFTNNTRYSDGIGTLNIKNSNINYSCTGEESRKITAISTNNCIIDNSNITTTGINGITVDPSLSVINSSNVIINNAPQFGIVLNNDKATNPTEGKATVDLTSIVKIINENSILNTYHPVQTTVASSFDEVGILVNEEYDIPIRNCEKILITEDNSLYIVPYTYKTTYLTNINATFDDDDDDDDDNIDTYYNISTSSCPTVKLSTNSSIAGKKIYVNGVTGEKYTVRTSTGKYIATINGSGSFTMPANDVIISKDLINNAYFALNSTIFSKAYVYACDNSMNVEKIYTTKSTGEVKLNYGKANAGKIVKIYEGKKSNKKEYTTVTLDSNGKATITVQNGYNYTAIIE